MRFPDDVGIFLGVRIELLARVPWGRVWASRRRHSAAVDLGQPSGLLPAQPSTTLSPQRPPPEAPELPMVKALPSVVTKTFEALPFAPFHTVLRALIAGDRLCALAEDLRLRDRVIYYISSRRRVSASSWPVWGRS